MGLLLFFLTMRTFAHYPINVSVRVVFSHQHSQLSDGREEEGEEEGERGKSSQRLTLSADH